MNADLNLHKDIINWYKAKTHQRELEGKGKCTYQDLLREIVGKAYEKEYTAAVLNGQFSSSKSK